MFGGVGLPGYGQRKAVFDEQQILAQAIVQFAGDALRSFSSDKMTCRAKACCAARSFSNRVTRRWMPP